MKRLLGFVFAALMIVGMSFSVDAAASQPGRGKWRGPKGPKRVYFPYKNYGQYRRTQVGNRRYRLVRRYYWSRGIRLSRWVRVYY